MAYLSESSTWRGRRRRRQQVTLVVVLLLLVAAGGLGYAVYSGAIGGSGTVDVATLPPCPRATKRPLTPDRVVVNVYNATTRSGLAAEVATTLGRRSFRIGAVANDPLGVTVPGTAVVRHGRGGTAAAQLVASQVAGATLVRDARRTAVVDLVLGARYRSLRPLAKVSATATATPTCRPVRPASPTAGTPVGTVTPRGRTPDTRTTTTR